MNGVLLLAHGSRAPETRTAMDKLTELVRKRLPDYHIETAYMQFSEINIETGLFRLIEKGATEIIVAPYFLFDGVHIQQDIPKELDAFRKKRPDIKITLSGTLGVDDRIADVVADRITGVLS